MIVTITEGDILITVGIFFVIIAITFLVRFYDWMFAWNDDVNEHLVCIAGILLFTGIIAGIIGLNMNFEWLVIEVKKN